MTRCVFMQMKKHTPGKTRRAGIRGRVLRLPAFWKISKAHSGSHVFAVAASNTPGYIAALSCWTVISDFDGF